MNTSTMMINKLMTISPRRPPSSSSSSSSISTESPPSSTSLPLRTIPGSYGWPLLGPMSDRLDYFWFQGPETFFKKRIESYKSTVFRTNVPPSFPLFLGVNPNVVAVLDVKSFSHLFDMDIVEKTNVLVGDFMPSVNYTGGIRTCAYLDTSEPQHAKGPETFFKKRIESYKSTVFRTNVPPSFPLFLGVNPNVVAVLDFKSFAHLFDLDIVEKKNVLVGDFMPSVNYTGGIRTCSYLDTSEPQHAKIKAFALDILKGSSKVWVTELLASLDTMWDTIDTEFSQKGEAGYFIPLQKCIFNFLTKSIVGADPAKSPDIAKSGYIMLDLWLGLQLLPTIPITAFQPLVEILFHTFTYPAFLVRGGYNKLYEFIKKEGTEVIQRAETEYGLSEEQTINNILFMLGFNAFGGFSIFLPTLINAIASDTTGLQEKLRLEARQNGGSGLTFESVKAMPLIQSVVYETLRLNPPVPIQYARARRDFQLSSHDSVFEVKKGELLCGYQPLVMKDSKVFDDPETFKPDRFMDQGNELLRYLYWSNGPQTGCPSESNKQCAGKDHVTLTASLIVAYLFRRYDSITGTSSSITALQKATK